ncbi:hypothetical protein VPH35_082101 [Triticum aestivum]|uniref:Protein FAR1-RELATED SEQUENCE n=1 Tax=Triticum turgidum subsp. durum TaxID=4567 RepID=A0A9R0WK36_TRITD|nr:unnamed protein product [Triticum turgidum subsp. durum]
MYFQITLSNKDNSLSLSFTYRHATLYLEAMEVMHMGDASAACYDHVNAGLDALLLSSAPLAEVRDGLAFEDQLAVTADARKGKEIATASADHDAGHSQSAGQSASINKLQGLGAPNKHRGAGRPTNSRDKATYEGLSKRTRFCSICRCEGHKKTTCPERGDTPKKPRKPAKCKNCRIEGHRRNTCKRPLGLAEQ